MAATKMSPRQMRPGEITLTDAATVAVNAALGNRFRLATASNRTIGAPSNPTAGQQIIIGVRNTAGAARTMTMASGAGGYSFGSEITAITATAAGKTDYITASYDSVNNRWHIIGYSKGYQT